MAEKLSASPITMVLFFFLDIQLDYTILPLVIGWGHFFFFFLLEQVAKSGTD